MNGGTPALRVAAPLGAFAELAAFREAKRKEGQPVRAGPAAEAPSQEQAAEASPEPAPAEGSPRRRRRDRAGGFRKRQHPRLSRQADRRGCCRYQEEGRMASTKETISVRCRR